ncbi:hypothetical protein [Deinococcus alpinitundrae]|nr:hypothetical protein [Deinococcus alpinitundrae]
MHTWLWELGFGVFGDWLMEAGGRLWTGNSKRERGQPAAKRQKSKAASR